MRIVNHETFLRQPAGTIFCKIFEGGEVPYPVKRDIDLLEMCVKQNDPNSADVLTGGYSYIAMTGYFGNCEFTDQSGFQTMLGGASADLNYELPMTDADSMTTDMFMIWEKQDAIELIAMLAAAFETAYLNQPDKPALLLPSWMVELNK